MTSAPTTAAPPRGQDPATPEGWLDRARLVRSRLEVGAAGRDRERRAPFAEIGILRDAGLLTLLGPREYGGGGMEWPLAYRVVREVAAADGSLGQLLGDHFTWFWLPRVLGTPDQIRRWEAAVTRDRAFIGCAVNPRYADVAVRDLGEEVVFDGRKNFATGVSVSDVTMLEGVLEGSDTHVVAGVPTAQPGIVTHGDWDNMGQRLTESGGVTVRGVRAPWTDALGFDGGRFHPRVYNTMSVPIGQLVFANFWCGIARGALDTAVVMARGGGPARPGGVHPAADPRVLGIAGDLTARIWSAEALLDDVAQEALVLHRDPDALTERARGEHKVRTAAVKAHVTDVVLEVASRIFEMLGPEATATRHGLDRFWRNVRTHTLHHPVAYQRQEVGAFALRDDVPVPGKYS